MEIDGDLKGACGNLAKDLGATGDFADGKAACEAAIKVMGEVRAKIGAKRQGLARRSAPALLGVDGRLR